MKRLLLTFDAGLLTLSACTGKGTVGLGSNGTFTLTSGTELGSRYLHSGLTAAASVSRQVLGGGPTDLTPRKSKGIVLNFWATWRAVSHRDRQFERIYRKIKTSGVDVLGIDTHEAVTGTVRSFVKNVDISYPIVFDKQDKKAVRLGSLPDTAKDLTGARDKLLGER